MLWVHGHFQYCRSDNIREVSIFVNFAREDNNYYYNSSTIEQWKFANSKLREKSQNQKLVKIYTRENYQIYGIWLF